jgi:hypothetical protein
MGMFVAGQRSIHAVTRNDLVSEGRSWGLLASVAEELVEQMLADIEQIEAVLAEEAGVPAAMLDFVARRRESLAAGQAAGHGERSTSQSM